MRDKKKQDNSVTKLRQTVTPLQDSYVEKSREEKRRDREQQQLENSAAEVGKNIIFEN